MFLAVSRSGDKRRGINGNGAAGGCDSHPPLPDLDVNGCGLIHCQSVCQSYDRVGTPDPGANGLAAHRVDEPHVACAAQQLQGGNRDGRESCLSDHQMAVRSSEDVELG